VFGPEDVDASTYGLEFVVSRFFSRFEPYVSVSGYLSHARETTSKVDLESENAFGAQATVGVVAEVSALRLGIEYHAARVPGASVKVGVGL
jgi:hypothetical protein